MMYSQLNWLKRVFTKEELQIINKQQLVNTFHGIGSLWSNDNYEVHPSNYFRTNVYLRANVEGYGGFSPEHAEFYVVIKNTQYITDSYSMQELGMFTGNKTASNDVLFRSSNFDECINWCVEQGVNNE